MPFSLLRLQKRKSVCITIPVGCRIVRCPALAISLRYSIEGSPSFRKSRIKRVESCSPSIGEHGVEYRDRELLSHGCERRIKVRVHFSCRCR